MFNKTQSLLSFCILLALAFTGFTACDTQENTINSEIAYYRQSQLRNVYRNGIQPDLVTFSNNLNEFSTIADAAMSDNHLDLSELVSLQNAWISMSKSWSRCELFNLGQVSDEFLHTGIYWWPIAPEKIDAIIDQAVAPWNINHASQLGADLVGIASLEYLLFNGENEELVLEINASTVRGQFLLSVIQNLKTETAQIVETWSEYQNEFETQLDGDLKGSQNKLLNALVNHLEVIVIDKLGKPINALEEDHLTQAYLSRQSLPFLRENLVTIEKLYTGDYADTPFPVGFDDFLIRVGNESTAVDILEQITECISTLDAIGSDLESALLDSPAEVRQLQNDFIELLVLIKVDLGNQLGATITISPNDGD